MRSIWALAMVSALLLGCAADGSGQGTWGDVCSEAARRCPGMSAAQCTEESACALSCLLESSCSADARFVACVRARCEDRAIDGGDAPPSNTASEDDASREEDDEHDDAGTDTGGGAWGCRTQSPNSCMCAPGLSDDGKGCSRSSLASKGVCCATASRCRCESVLCTSNSSGCSCIVGGSGSSTTCTGPLCCAFPANGSGRPGACVCYNKPGTGGCAALGGTTVSSCTPERVPCYYQGETSVSTCR